MSLFAVVLLVLFILLFVGAFTAMQVLLVRADTRRLDALLAGKDA